MEFRDRAWFEAERYGADPWIFVRELLQNGRDAGARSVRFTVSERDGQVRLTCRDDGDGMTEAHARQFLFRLYASSKENETGAAGRFGVGFWSILRFDPSHIVIRSWPRGGKPWEVTLDGALKHAAAVAPPDGPHGTEIVLTRPLVANVAGQVKRAASMHGRYLTTRADRQVAMDITVDDERVSEELQLPAPSAVFQRRGVRGVVALGGTPHVELFSKGLHVRSAASVDELLATPDEGKGKSRQMDPLLEGLAPHVILDGDQLNLVRSRSDARDDKALRRAVELSQRELARLIERQLQFSRPVPLWKRVLRPAIATLAVGAAVLGGGWLVASFVRPIGGRPAIAEPVRVPGPPSTPYRDPSNDYRGPRTDALPATSALNDLRYWPSSKTLFLSALHLQLPEDSAVVRRFDVRERYRGQGCTSDCVRMSMTIAAQPGWVRLPVPSGQVLDPLTLRWDGEQAAVYRTAQGEPVLWVDERQTANVSYRTGPGVPQTDAPLHEPKSRPAYVPDVSTLRTEKRVEVLRTWVAQHVKYSNDPAVGERHRALERQGVDFITRAVTVGAGDCDVQNALLAMLLQSADVQARLAVGHVGRNGYADPLLHAWVEYRVGQGPWSVTDASAPLTPAVAGASREPTPAVVGEAEETAAWVGSRSSPRQASGVVPAVAEPQRFALNVPVWRVPPRAVGLLGLAPLLALAFVILRPRVKRQVQLDETHDVSRLLQGALARPEAFAHVPALFEQPLVPTRGGRPISLSRAYELASAERLYSSDAGLAFSERAVASGGVVLDAMRPEGKVVAEALGAVNLDRWDRLLRVVQVSPLLERVNAELARRGERWTVMLSPAVSREPAVLKVPGTKDDRWIVINGDALWLTAARRLALKRPARALFMVIDQLAAWLRLPGVRRARLLSALARAALLEEAAPAAPVAAAVEQPELQPVSELEAPDADGVAPRGPEGDRLGS